jgi:hypothetical protein
MAWTWSEFTELQALMMPGVDLDVDLLDRDERSNPTSVDGRRRPQPPPPRCVDCRRSFGPELKHFSRGRCSSCAGKHRRRLRSG